MIKIGLHVHLVIDEHVTSTLKFGPRHTNGTKNG